MRRDVVTGENIHVLRSGDVLGLVPRWPPETLLNDGMVALKVVEDAVTSAVVLDVSVLVAVIVFLGDVIVVVVVSTEPKNGNRLHQSSSFSAEFVVVVVGRTQLLVDDGG